MSRAFANWIAVGSTTRNLPLCLGDPFEKCRRRLQNLFRNLGHLRCTLCA